jgi:hypothetical protein
MFETDAQARWCPFAKESDENFGTYNRTGGQRVQAVDENGFRQYETDDHGVPLHSKPIMRTEPPGFPPSCCCLTTACMAWTSTKPGEGFCRRLVMIASQSLSTGLHIPQTHSLRPTEPEPS